jgi:hypothetical protein
MSNKKVKIPFVTPAGSAQFAHLKTPDDKFGNTPKYQTGLIVDDARDLVKKIDDLAAAEFGAKAKNAKVPYKKDEETGQTVLKAWSYYAPFFKDSQGSVILDSKVPELWNGSELRLKGEIVSYDTPSNGIRLQLLGVQIINPVGPSGDGQRDTSGFDAVEGGYVSDNDIEEMFDDEEPSQEEVPKSAANF